MKARHLISFAAVTVALAGPAAGQVTTAIVPDAAAGLATGTTITQAGAVTTIDGGVRAGGNVFHSFTTFDLAAGSSARWTAPNPAAVANVVNRVTGGRFSTIAGTIDTTALPNADFYFINPAGVLFSSGARLNVPGAAHVSTAGGGLRFADGTTFAALMPNGATFSQAPPESFGFLGSERGIVIDTVGGIFVPATTRLSLTAANIGVQGSVFTPLTADLVATGQQTRSVSLADPLGGAPLGGTVLLVDSRIFTTATGKGVQAIRIGADTFSQVGGFLTSSTVFSGDAGDLLIRARDVDITGFVASNTSESARNGNAGAVSILASTVRVGDGGQVSSSTFGVGNAGSLTIVADDLLIETGASIGSDTIGANATGKGGTVQINVGVLTVRDGGAISSSTNGRGDAGSIRIKADTVLLDTFGGINSVALAGSGNGGLVQINSGVLDIRNQAGVASFGASAGAAGMIQIAAGKMTMSSGANIFSTSTATGDAGNVSIVATSLELTDGVISSDTRGMGRAGVVSISATDLSVSNSVVSSESRGGGNAGDVRVTAKRLHVTNDSLISSSTGLSGAGGEVAITADQANFDFSEVRSQANLGSTGAAGSVLINVGLLKITNQTVISSSTFGAGDAGPLSIIAKDVLLDDSAVASRTLAPGSGRGGKIVIQTGTFTLDNNAGVSSSTSSSGNAGGVTITATKVTLDHGATIESGAALGSSGDGGTVNVATDTLTLRNGSSLVTSTLALGDAGQLQISAGDTSVESGSLLSSRARGAALGSAGGIQLTGRSLQLLSSGQIETSSQNVNRAGGINISMSGLVSITGIDSHVASENLSATGGAAGAIVIAGAPMVLAEIGSISTNSTTGAAGDISLILPRDSVLRLESRSVPSVITTSSGPGTGGRIVISEPLAVISNGGSILALGQAQGANVQIRSDFFIRSADRVNLLSVDGDLVLDSQVSDVSAGVAIPDVSFLDASGVLRGQCPAARSGGITSQLSLRAYGPYSLDATPAPARASGLNLGAPSRLGGCQ